LTCILGRNVAREIAELEATSLSLTGAELTAEIEAWATEQELTELLDRRVSTLSTLSGGQRQRLGWLRALVQLSQAGGRGVLLMDEALSAQDLRQRHR